ncbi:MAG: glycosyltransferase [Bacteroidota bacterium]
MRAADRLSVAAWPGFANRTGNPYNRLLYAPMGDLGVDVHEFTVPRFVQQRYDVWHLHWPEGLARSGADIRAWLGRAAFQGLLRLARRRRTRVIWTAHNLGAHDEASPDQADTFWRQLAQHLDGVISLSAAALAQLEACHPSYRSVPSRVIPHGHYRDVIGSVPVQAEARRVLGLGDVGPVVAHIGAIRAYKNVPKLLRAFAAMPDQQARLLIAGAVNEDTLEAEVRSLARADPRVHLWLGYQSDEQLAHVVAASDVVVLPYQAIANSGSALYALSCDRPVTVPALGSMQELRTQVGLDWVQVYEGPFTPEVLSDAIAWAQQRSRSSRAPLDGLGWGEIAAQTVAFYRTLRPPVHSL